MVLSSSSSCRLKPRHSDNGTTTDVVAIKAPQRSTFLRSILSAFVFFDCREDTKRAYEQAPLQESSETIGCVVKPKVLTNRRPHSQHTVTKTTSKNNEFGARVLVALKIET
jgi:hypothetical protein